VTGRRGILLGAVAAVVAIAVVAYLFLGGRGSAGTSSPGVAQAAQVSGPKDATLPEVDTASLVDGLEKESVAKIDPTRLADGLVPPTNRWFSGLVFGDEPQPVFPLPASFGLTDSGFGIGLPKPVTSEKAIVGPHVPGVTVDAGAAGSRVSAYDAVSVTTELLDGSGAVLGTVVIAEGSPFVSFTAGDAGASLTLDAPFTTDDVATPVDGTEVATATAGDADYGLVAPAGALDGTGVQLDAGESATWYPLPTDASDEALGALAAAAADAVVGSEVSYGVGDDVARTTVGYRTASGGTSAYVTMPHHRTGTQPERADCGLGEYPSVYGTLELCAGSTLTTWAPVLEPAGALDLSGASDDQLDAIRDQLAKDVAGTEPFPSDTYFGGKALNRAATLVALGRELGAEDVVEPLREKVTETLLEWADPARCAQADARCFVYDDDARGVVGLTPSFGSEEFNDHHFHYGYFLAAAGLLAADDPELAEQLAPVMDVLAQDIAAATASEWFPQLRTFDVYAGHAWASGTSPFADGNNQESSSEAVNAWNGLGLWAQASGQDDLAVQATWLASTESATTKAYWTDPDLADPVYEGFDHLILSLNWGGKRDYATWFSPEPNAMLGILLLPLSPVSGYLAGDPEGITARVKEAAPNGYDVQFGDYLLMYAALAGDDAAATAWEEAGSLPEERIDDGNSRAYLLAWLAAAASGGIPSVSSGS
jgi:endoglucanase Acf2